MFLEIKQLLNYSLGECIFETVSLFFLFFLSLRFAAIKRSLPALSIAIGIFIYFVIVIKNLLDLIIGSKGYFCWLYKRIPETIFELLRQVEEHEILAHLIYWMASVLIILGLLKGIRNIHLMRKAYHDRDRDTTI